MSAAPTTEPKPAPPPVETIKVKVDGREIDVPKMMPDWQGKLQRDDDDPGVRAGRRRCAALLLSSQAAHRWQLPHVPGGVRHARHRAGPQAGAQSRRHAEDLPFRIALRTCTPRGAIACATPISPGMEIYPEFSRRPNKCARRCWNRLLINHPLDCPICDQAGECKLQEYSVDYGKAASRFVEEKVHKPKHVDLGSAHRAGRRALHSLLALHPFHARHRGG